MTTDDYGTRPPECCGKCPPILSGGYDCTCEGNPRCSVTAADRPSVTDDARAEAERRYDLPLEVTQGRYLPEVHARTDRVAAFVAGAEWAADRAETTTEATERIARQIAAMSAMTGRDARELVEAVQALQDAETTTATTEDAVGELLERMSDAATQLEALRDGQWYPPERQRLHGKVEGVKLAASYVEEARDLLATARTRPTREEVATAVGAVLFNAMNHPNPAAVLGKSMTPLRAKVTDAVMALLDGGEQ